MYKPESEMKQAAKLVVYELERFLYASPRVVRWNVGTGTNECEDYIIEAFLLHARILRDFFNRRREETKRYEETDIVAEDFFDRQNQWESFVFEYLERKREQLNRALAHLSYDRLGYEERGDKWDYSTITSEIKEAFDAFREALPNERKAWFEINIDLEDYYK